MPSFQNAVWFRQSAALPGTIGPKAPIRSTHALRCAILTTLAIVAPMRSQAQAIASKRPIAQTASPSAIRANSVDSKLALIFGNILGSDGRPMKLAYARIRKINSLAPDGGPEVALARVNDDGSFSIATSVSGGIILELSGSQHEEQQLPLRVYPGFRLSIDVRIPRIEYRLNVDSVRAIGDFNAFRNDTSGRILQKQRDGIWTLDVSSKSDSVVYALIGVARRGSTTSPSSTRDVLSASGSYRSVAPVRSGSARIEFDPARLVRDTLPVKYTFRGGVEARAARIGDSIQAHNRLAGLAERESRAIDASTWNLIVQRTTHELSAERNPLVREMLIFELLNVSHLGGRIPPTIGRMSLRELPPSSPAWRTVTSLVDDLANEAVIVADSIGEVLHSKEHKTPTPSDSARLHRYAQHAVARTDSMLQSETEDGMRAQLLFWNMEAVRKWIPERALISLGQLQTEFPDAFLTRMALQRYGDQRILRPGTPMPAFDVGALNDSKQRFTNATFSGKVVLVDFWASWCLPCIGEMSTLHDAYEKYHGRGLEILSVSADHTPSDAQIFRRDKWPMPWQHAWVAGSINAEEFKALGISGIPRIVLIGPDGNILAEGSELRGGALQTTLERVLK